MNTYKKIEGLISAVFTPLKGNGDINLDAIPEYALRLKQQGLAGVFVNGSSGEGMMLSIEERKRLAEAWMTHSEENFKIIIHVGSTSVRISMDLAAHGEEIGAYAIGCMAPNFFPSSDVAVIIDYCRQVAAFAPNLPFYYYHLPIITGANIKVHQLLEEGSKLIPNLAGVKFTHNDFMDMHQCMDLQDGRFAVLHGHEEVLINGLVLGVRGAIGTTFNFIPGVYHKIMEAYENNDIELAKKHQMTAINIVEVMLRHVNAIVGGKAIMKLSGIDCGPCRTPLRNLNEKELKNLEKELFEIGFFDLIGNSKIKI